MLDITTPIQYVKGVGPKKAEALAEVGIRTVYDLLLYLPFRYEDRSRRWHDCRYRVRPERDRRGRGRVGERPQRPADELQDRRAGAKDDSGKLKAVWFNQEYLKDTLTPGRRVLIYGTFEHTGFSLVPGGEKRAIRARRGRTGRDDARGSDRSRLRAHRADEPEDPEACFAFSRHRDAATACPSCCRKRSANATNCRRVKMRSRRSTFPKRMLPSSCSTRFARDAQKRLIFEELFLFFLALELRRAADKDDVEIVELSRR